MKKILSVLLSLTLIVSAFYVAKPTTVQADSAYYIKVANSNTYLYANGDSVGAGNKADNDNYKWYVTNKGDGTYWIQNKGNGAYMAIEHKKGYVELLGTIYDVWDSSKWVLNLNGNTTIQNKWVGSDANINVADNKAVYNSGTTSFVFENADSGSSGETGGGTQPSNGNIPGADSNIANIGADMPYTRYDSTIASLGNGASLVRSDDIAKNNIASQASERSYIELPNNNSYAEWTCSTVGNGVTMRFTMPDSSDGRGLNGSLDVYVNGNKVQTVNLTSYFMWQYFPNSFNGEISDAPVDNATACFAFDEVHFMLNQSLKKGDKIRIQSTKANNLKYGVDFLEIEEVSGAISKPANAYSVTDFGAVANDGASDLNAFNSCVAAASRDGKEVYIPAGEFNIDQIWHLSASNIKISGAGMWYTTIKFTSDAKQMGGISGDKANNVEFCNIYLNSNLRSRYGENAIYKCFMDVWTNCNIHDIWEEHFECGFWMADYNFGDGADYSDGMTIANCRIRNNFADGVNFCQGTSNATVYNCSIRNNGDDGLAMWNNDYNVKDESNNVFCYNTIDLIWRAGAIAIYGGNGHKIYNNYISDTFMASGIHLNTVFPGFKFNNNNNIEFSNNILVRSGTSSDCWNGVMGAVDLSEQGAAIRNITFNNTYIYNAANAAVRTAGTNVNYNNTQVNGEYNQGSSVAIPMGKNKVASAYVEETTTQAQTTTKQTTTQATTKEITTQATTKQATTADPSVINVSNQVNIDGYQISATVQGLRAVYTAANSINGSAVVERGLVYGIAGRVDDSQLFAGTSNAYARTYRATNNGNLGKNYSQSISNGTSYAMTMKFMAFTQTEFNSLWKIRAYAKLADGRMYYSNVETYSIGNVASSLYDNCLMNNNNAHTYLYENILKKINANYPKVDYKWGNGLVK